ncbi:MAG: FtsX-like permease family protein, partial [Micromonosporaceae bacterium]
LATDPLAQGATNLLTGSALLALLVGVVALVLLVVAERRDEAAQLYAWESDGVAPATLRRALFLRAVAVVAVGVPGGVLIGVALSRVTAALVRLTAAGADPVPPLRLAVGPLWSVAVVGAGFAIGLAACAAVTATALREPLPRRPEEEPS